MNSFGLNEMLDNIIGSKLEDEVYTVLPGIVEDIDLLPTEQCETVRPTLNTVFNPDIVIESPVIYRVPVVFPGGGGGFLTFPIQVGDPILLLFAKNSIDDWLLTDGKSTLTPKRPRSFNLSDAIAIPGLSTTSNNATPNATDVELKFKTLSLKLEAGGDITVANASHSLKLKANGDVLHSSGAKITAAGDFVTALGISLDLHTHVGSPTAPTGSISNTGVPL